MLDNKVSNECEEILSSIKRNNAIIEKVISTKDEEINRLKEALALSESGKQLAENMVTQIKEEFNGELQKAYNSGYNAALSNVNPVGGTTISQESDKKLVLNQN